MPAGSPPELHSPVTSAVGPRRLSAGVSTRPFTALSAVCGLLALLAGCRVGATAAAPTTATTAATVRARTAAPAARPAALVAGKAIPAPSAGGWRLNGSARLSAGTVLLTKAGVKMTAGSVIWPHTLRGITSLSASFDVASDGGTGADGITFALINARTGRPTSLGRVGGGLGWAGIPGQAIALDTFQNPGDPSYNTVGLVTGFNRVRQNRLTWAKWSTAIPSWREDVRHVTVVVVHRTLTVTVDAVAALTAPIVLPEKLLIGFTAANGARSDRHVVSNVVLTAG